MRTIVPVIIAIGVILSTLRAHGQVEVPELVGYINSDGKIVVRSLGEETIQTPGLELVSAKGSLVPIPPGDLTASSDPFTFLLANDSNRIFYGNFGSVTGITSAGLTLEAGYDGNPCGDLVALWGSVFHGPYGFCSIPGDVNFDGLVEFADFVVLSSNFGAAPADWTMGDFDFDRQVKFSDFLALSVNFGLNAVQMTSVPEASGQFAVWMATLGCLIGLRGRTGNRSSCLDLP